MDLSEKILNFLALIGLTFITNAIVPPLSSSLKASQQLINALFID